MIESDWKKFCERVRDKQTIAQDEVVIKEAIEALHPGAAYTMTNIAPYRIVFGDSREYDPVAILTKVKEMNYTVTNFRPTTNELLDKIWKDIDAGTLNTSGSFYEALKPFIS